MGRSWTDQNQILDTDIEDTTLIHTDKKTNICEKEQKMQYDT